MTSKRVLIKGLLYNGEFFLGRFPKELDCVSKSAHKVVALPAIIMEDQSFVKMVDEGEIHNLLPNALITSPYNILFEGQHYRDDEGKFKEGLFLNEDNPYTKGDIENIMKALETLRSYQLLSAFGM